MRVRVLFFAAVREIAGTGEVARDLEEGARLRDLDLLLKKDFPALEGLPFLYALNQDYAGPDRKLEDGDEVALIPAISGGAGLPEFAFTEEPIALDPLLKEARSDRDGAVVVFLGTTRNHHEGREVEDLAYEAYEDMARRKMESLLGEIRGGRDLGRVLVRHRLGRVPIGEASIVVVAAAPHRKEAFEAARELMDRIKAEVPIFKKERLAGGGEARWVGELPEPRDRTCNRDESRG